MSIEKIRHALFWCTIINFGFLLLWFVVFKFGPGWKYYFWGAGTDLSREQFLAINLTGIMLYKIGIILFNLVPYVALRIVGSEGGIEPQHRI
jgi:Family of unknown function (DUF6868)